MIPYGRQTIDDEDIQAVVDVLKSDWITTGPKVAEFENTFAAFVGSKYAVAVSSGTAALHSAMFALGIGPGDEVILPPMTFAATANCVVYQGGTPVFVDVDQESLLIDPVEIEKKITRKTKAIIAVDYAGQPCHYERLRAIADQYGLALVADACHSLGGSYNGHPVGSLADLNVFSFHPVKHITTGEGGMVTTNDYKLAQRMRTFRNHGITADHRQREEEGSWLYEMVDLGYNYRLTDFQCALGITQLSKLPDWLVRRREIASRYDSAFTENAGVRPLLVQEGVLHPYHLYVIRISAKHGRAKRQEVFSAMRANGIGVNVHYIPVHLHPYYQQRFGTKRGLCPNAEAAYDEILSLPIFPLMTNKDVENIVATLEKVLVK